MCFKNRRKGEGKREGKEDNTKDNQEMANLDEIVLIVSWNSRGLDSFTENMLLFKYEGDLSFALNTLKYMYKTKSEILGSESRVFDPDPKRLTLNRVCSKSF